MPRRTGTRTAAQSASTTSGAAALPYYYKVPARRSAPPAIKMGGPGAAHVFAQTKRNDNATTGGTFLQWWNPRRSRWQIVRSTWHSLLFGAMRAGSLAGKRAGPVLVPGFP